MSVRMLKLFIGFLLVGFVSAQKYHYNYSDNIVTNSTGDRILCCNTMQIAGIVIASILLLILIIAWILYCIRRRLGTSGYSQIF